jgi:hypothetical protein
MSSKQPCVQCGRPTHYLMGTAAHFVCKLYPLCKPVEPSPEVPADDGLLHDRPIAEERGRPAKSVKVSPEVPAPDEDWSRRVKASLPNGVNALFWCDGEDQTLAVQAANDWVARSRS